MKRGDFLGRASVGAAVLGFPAIVRSQNAVPRVVSGVQAGDVTGGRAVIWSRSSKPGEMEVEWATNEKFENSTIVGNAFALKSTGLCAKADIAAHIFGKNTSLCKGGRKTALGFEFAHDGV